MTNEDEVARALAFFEACDDVKLLIEVVRSIRPRAARQVGRYERAHRDVPPPAALPAAGQASTREEALRTVRRIDDFALLQAVARGVGRRIEELQASGSQPPAP